MVPTAMALEEEWAELQMSLRSAATKSSSVKTPALFLQQETVIVMPPGRFPPYWLVPAVVMFEFPKMSGRAALVRHWSFVAQPLVVMHSLPLFMNCSQTSIVAQYHVSVLSFSRQSTGINWYALDPIV